MSPHHEKSMLFFRRSLKSEVKMKTEKVAFNGQRTHVMLLTARQVALSASENFLLFQEFLALATLQNLPTQRGCCQLELFNWRPHIVPDWLETASKPPNLSRNVVLLWWVFVY